MSLLKGTAATGASGRGGNHKIEALMESAYRALGVDAIGCEVKPNGHIERCSMPLREYTGIAGRVAAASSALATA